MKENDVIHLNSVVSSKSGLPFIQIKWGENGCQMTPEEAREHAYAILDCANAAETDSIMLRYLMEKVGLDMSNAAVIMQDFRRLRENKNPITNDGSHRHKH